MYTNLDTNLLDELVALLGAEKVASDQATTHAYGNDHTEDFSFPPAAVVFPTTAQEVSRILKWANTHKIPVTAIGGQTGLSGGMLALHGGIGLSLKNMNRILEIDEQNLQVRTQPGVITQVLRDAVAEKGLFYPVDPSSQGSCFIGGNIAENSGGARAVKYGTTKDYVLNLQVVRADGHIFWTGANTLKNATGYNLTQLIVGSEGTLGIVTEIVLKLLPLPRYNQLLLVPFRQSQHACEAVSAIFRQGIVPSALEFMERDALLWTQEYLKTDALAVPETVQAHLLIEVDGNNPNVLMQEIEQVYEVVSQFDVEEALLADTHEQKEQLWRLRRAVGEAVKSQSVYKEEDTVVPRYELPNLLAKVKALGAQYGFKSVCYGHAGDGNLHINIIRGDLDERTWKEELPKAITELFEYTVSLGGTLSGEHGIGYVQKDYMSIAFDSLTLELMRQIKHAFDPNGILNPGKIFPEK